MAHEEVEILRGHLYANSCTHSLQEVLIVENEVDVRKDEVDDCCNMWLQIQV